MKISAPNYTQTPNDLFDHWLPILKESDLKVFLVIMKKTHVENENQKFVTTSQIKKLTNLNLETTIYAISSLKQTGLIEEYIIDLNDILSFLKNKTPQKIDEACEICEWCKGTSFILHSHHYPKKKADGGTNTVNICASCHCEFHFLQDSKKYRVASNILDVLKEGAS